MFDNARKYSENPIIQLKARKTDRNAVVEISDNGRGIPEEEHKKIFKKYYRVSEGDRHQVKGFGLGLNYVQRIVQRSGGKINVRSATGTGTTFIISIPLSRAHEDEKDIAG